MCSRRLPHCVVSVYLYMFSFCLLNVLLLLLCCVTCTTLNLRRVGATHCHEIQYLSIYQGPVEKIQVSLKSDVNTGTLQKYIYTHTHTLMTISCSIILSMRNCSNKICRENQNTRTHTCVCYDHIFLISS